MVWMVDSYRMFTHSNGSIPLRVRRFSRGGSFPFVDRLAFGDPAFPDDAPRPACPVFQSQCF